MPPSGGIINKNQSQQQVGNMIRHLILTAAFSLVTTVAFAQDKPAAKADEVKTHAFIGVKKCMMCHKGETKGNVYEKWADSKHAKAFQTLVDKKDGSEKNAECLACHTTGYGKGGYVAGAENAAEFQGVQCEMCHGAGGDFKLTHSKDPTGAAALGFVAKPDEKTCKQCHNEKNPNFAKVKPFKYEDMHKIIDHRYRAKAKADAAK